MFFIVTAMDKPNSKDTRMATRSDHLAYIGGTNGAARLGGPFLNDAGEMIGSMVILEAENLDAAKAFAAGDPYAKAGLFQSVTITPWKPTVNYCNAEL
ncbi:MAG TPA: YciI family protein [Rhizomicrobium sp.]|jgi:uncharacterized protein YciI|nr:YciI family protein [Rhizomicrobium sp.]